MVKDLYFIPIIEQALQGEDLDEGLREAFTRIIRKGQEPGYGHAFEQFQRFMEEVKSAHALMGEEEQLDLSVDAIAQLFPLQIIIEKEEQLFETYQFDRIPDRYSIKNIIPGEYRLKMETGRIFWKGFITEKDCIWRKAYPGQPLKLAADTGEQELRPTRSVPLLGGMVLLNIYPGVETGVLEIELKEGNGE